MTQPNLRLRLRFDLELMVPHGLSEADHASLCRQLGEVLGSTVLQGLPAISAKQLAKAGVSLLSHHHHLEVENLAAMPLAAGRVHRAAPHLTDAEVAELCLRAAPKAPADEGELLRYLRRQALALVSEYRLVPCTLHAQLSSGAPVEIPASLNLTNGSVMLAEQHRKSRLNSGQGAIAVLVEGLEQPLGARLSGHTLSGPVLDVEVERLVPHRDLLVSLWQRGS